MKLDRRELAGAVADLGVFVPIAVTLVAANGLSATAVLFPAGLLYAAAAFLYRLPDRSLPRARASRSGSRLRART